MDTSVLEFQNNWTCSNQSLSKKTKMVVIMNQQLQFYFKTKSDAERVGAFVSVVSICTHSVWESLSCNVSNNADLEIRHALLLIMKSAAAKERN
jgi:hypothetical protein